MQLENVVPDLQSVPEELKTFDAHPSFRVLSNRSREYPATYARRDGSVGRAWCCITFAIGGYPGFGL